MKRTLPKLKKLACLASFAAFSVFFCACNKGIPKYIATSATLEAGSTFSASDFLLEGGHTAEFSSDFASRFVQDGIAKINQLGEISVGLTVDGELYNIILNVQDTIPPTASAGIITVSQGDVLTAEQCLTNIKDQTEVSCAFQTEPDLTQVGLTKLLSSVQMRFFKTAIP